MTFQKLEELFNEMRSEMWDFLWDKYMDEKDVAELMDHTRMVDELYKSVRDANEDFSPHEIIEAIFVDGLTNSQFYRMLEDCEDGEAGMVAEFVLENRRKYELGLEPGF